MKVLGHNRVITLRPMGHKNQLTTFYQDYYIKGLYSQHSTRKMSITTYLLSHRIQTI